MRKNVTSVPVALLRRERSPPQIVKKSKLTDGSVLKRTIDDVQADALVNNELERACNEPASQLPDLNDEFRSSQLLENSTSSRRKTPLSLAHVLFDQTCRPAGPGHLDRRAEPLTAPSHRYKILKTAFTSIPSSEALCTPGSDETDESRLCNGNTGKRARRASCGSDKFNAEQQSVYATYGTESALVTREESAQRRQTGTMSTLSDGHELYEKEDDYDGEEIDEKGFPVTFRALTGSETSPAFSDFRCDSTPIFSSGRPLGPKTFLEEPQVSSSSASFSLEDEISCEMTCSYEAPAPLELRLATPPNSPRNNMERSTLRERKEKARPAKRSKTADLPLFAADDVRVRTGMSAVTSRAKPTTLPHALDDESDSNSPADTYLNKLRNSAANDGRRRKGIDDKSSSDSATYQRRTKRLVKSSNVKELHLQVEDLGSSDVLVITEPSKDETLEILLLALEKSVRSVIVRRSNIGIKGAIAIAEALRHNTSLHSLDLGCNNIGDEGAQAIAQALKQNTGGLQKIVLEDNRISARGGKALAAALEYNTRLQVIDLRENHIGVAGARRFAETLNSNTTLQDLNLRGNRIGDEGVEFLAFALENNISMQSLDLTGYNQISECEAKLIIDRRLESNRMYWQCIKQLRRSAVILWLAFRSMALPSPAMIRLVEFAAHNKRTPVMEVLGENERLLTLCEIMRFSIRETLASGKSESETTPASGKSESETGGSSGTKLTLSKSYAENVCREERIDLFWSKRS